MKRFALARAYATQIVAYTSENGKETKMICLVPMPVTINGEYAQGVFSWQGRKDLESKGFCRMSFFDNPGVYAAPYHPLTLNLAEEWHKSGFLYDEEAEKAKRLEKSNLNAMFEASSFAKLNKGISLEQKEKKVIEDEIARLRRQQAKDTRLLKLALKKATCATFNQH